ncbi:MAG: 4'-phosphopantetheinyl transferase superfamily protein [Cyclobacteriaceae bacterium]|nr:4'-phosphopantetheinyl transferase superfamily protein [Cyclobacteriaceae bacterium]
MAFSKIAKEYTIMPQLENEITQTRAWGLWKIEASEEDLKLSGGFAETIPAEIVHPEKRAEFFAVRALLHNLLQQLNLTYQGLTKDTFGKPSLRNYPHQVSLSHSYPYVTAIVDEHKPVGIDLEHFKPKLLRIAQRMFSQTEQADAGDNLIKNCIYWSAKEAMIKVYGKKDLVFAEHLLIEPFVLKQKGNLSGRIIANQKETIVSLKYTQYTDFVIVCSV